MYSHYDWLQLYQQYCDPATILPYNTDAIVKFLKFILQVVRKPVLAFPPILIMWHEKSPYTYKAVRCFFQNLIKSNKGNYFTPKKS